MTEISKAALERARELRNRIYSGGEIYTLADAKMRALARVLQEHSDVAKFADAGFEEARVHPTALTRTRLQSLILPDEPCDHLLNVCNLMALDAANPHLRCYKCGKALKIVEEDKL